MSLSIIEYFKTGSSLVTPVEFRFVRCSIEVEGREVETFRWMNEELRQELLEATLTILKKTQGQTKKLPNEPSLIETLHLRLAFLMKDSIFKKHILIQQTKTKTGIRGTDQALIRPAAFMNNDKMLVMSVSLNKGESSRSVQSLQTVLPQEQGQFKISGYFAQNLTAPE